MTLRDVAEELVEEGHYGEIPEKLQYFIDYDAIAQSLDNEGYAETKKGVFFYN
jgi:Antirestriction protein (ArdA)